MNEKRGNWQKISSKVVHTNPFYTVHEDQVIRPNGEEGLYHIISGVNAVFVVALDTKQCVHLVEMHRYTNNNLSIEVPGGGTDGEDPLIAAKRELQEETGLIAGTWKELGYAHPTNGFLTAKNHVYLATDLEQTSQDDQEEEGILRTIVVPLKQTLTMIQKGEITDTETIAALLFAALHQGLFLTE